EAPRPAALSPWKYSLNTRLSFHAGSFCRRSTHPKHGRRPSGPTRKIEISRSCRSSAMASSGRRRPEPPGDSRVSSSPKERGERLRVADDWLVEGHRARPPPVRVPAEHGGRRLGRLVVDRGADAVEVERVRVVAMVGGQGAQAVRGEELPLIEQPGEEPLE